MHFNISRHCVLLMRIIWRGWECVLSAERLMIEGRIKGRWWRTRPSRLQVGRMTEHHRPQELWGVKKEQEDNKPSAELICWVETKAMSSYIWPQEHLVIVSLWIRPDIVLLLCFLTFINPFYLAQLNFAGNNSIWWSLFHKVLHKMMNGKSTPVSTPSWFVGPNSRGWMRLYI